ncbi:MAG: pca operon transcription factor PcaQ [Woeseiaceae bacterium]|nr:pca operon transcription factor PcaQ [Woeseiaceae bacterium]
MVNSEPVPTTKQQLSRIRHRHLNCFLEIARTRKISAAAVALNISQPAASKTLAELEEILETKLFARRGKGGLRLTPAGRIFQRFAGSSVAALKEGIDGLAQAKLQRGPVLVVGALLGVAAQFMPRAVKEFQEAHGMTVRIITGPNKSMLNQLRIGEMDLVVGRLASPKEMQGLSFTHLYSEPLVFVGRPGHPLAGEAPVDLTMLEHLTLIMPTGDGLMRPVIDRFMLAHGVGLLTNTIEARSSEFCRQYLRDTDAVWMVSLGAVQHDIEDGVLCRLNVDTTETHGAVGLTVRSNRNPAPALQLMMDTITRVAAEFPHPH